jgi:hypothetical protein
MNWIYTRIASEIILSCVFCTIHSVAPKISNLKEGNSGKKIKKDGGIAREKADSIENCRCTKDL